MGMVLFLQNIWWYLVLIGVMILIHELGHFWAARYFDVKVDAHLDQGAKRDTVVYRITKEKKHKVEDVKLAGNSQLPSDQLAERLGARRRARLHSVPIPRWEGLLPRHALRDCGQTDGGLRLRSQ